MNIDIPIIYFHYGVNQIVCDEIALNLREQRMATTVGSILNIGTYGVDEVLRYRPENSIDSVFSSASNVDYDFVNVEKVIGEWATLDKIHFPEFEQMIRRERFSALGEMFVGTEASTRGAISRAPSRRELLEIKMILEEMSKTHDMSVAINLVDEAIEEKRPIERKRQSEKH